MDEDGGVKARAQEQREIIPSATTTSKPIDLQRLTTVLSSIESIEYAIFFGSAQDGLVRVGSDLDIAVSLTHAESHGIDDLLAIVGTVEEASGATCDLTVLNTAGIVLRHEALKGRILFVRPGCENDFSDFYARTCAEYEDLMAWRVQQLAYRGYICPSTA